VTLIWGSCLPSFIKVGRMNMLLRAEILPRRLSTSTFTSLISRQLLQHRSYASSSHESRPFPRRRRLLLPSLLGAGVAAISISMYQKDSNGSADPDRPLANVPFPTLLRSYVVYTACSISFLVDAGPAVIDWCSETTIPGVWSCIQYMIRHTFFKQVSLP